MNDIEMLHTVFFSPTGTSKKIIKGIAEKLKDLSVETTEYDLTYPGLEEEIHFSKNDFALIGVPVYAGRVAPLARRRLSRLKGSNTPAVIVVLYGNREFEDALLELRDLAVSQDFQVIAAGAFIGEHSFSSMEVPIGQGRPDESDMAVATRFGRELRDRFLQFGEEVINDPDIPGDFPYKPDMPDLPFTPEIDQEKCTLCEVCLPICPAGAIAADERIEMDVKLCIHCCACVKICPEKAVSISAQPLLEKRQWLHINCSERKEPDLFW